ncbi:MAG: hypothetical protein ABIQ40_01655 [Bacteroidia bacterium]
MTIAIFLFWAFITWIPFRRINNACLFIAAFTNTFWLSLYIVSAIIVGCLDRKNPGLQEFLKVEIILSVALLPLLIIDFILLVIFIFQLSILKSPGLLTPIAKIIPLVNSSTFPSPIRNSLIEKLKKPNIHLEEREVSCKNIYRLYRIRAAVLKEKGNEDYKFYELFIINLDKLGKKDALISCSIHLEKDDKRPIVIFFIDIDRSQLLGIV